MPLERDAILINRYRILETLGQGGMGSVYRAWDENLAVEVAVKENLFTTEEYNRQFRREATILATMRHPNLPRVSDHFEIANQGQYLVMDYIEGEDLRQRMDRVDVLPAEEVIVVGAAVCEALSYLHTRQPPILHRDLKPGNIKINPDGVVYLVDFGLAKIVSGSQATTTGARAMTPGYSSPEQYGTSRTDARSDIYSLGATLYASVTGIIPEDGLARAMEQTDLTPIRKHVPGAPRRLASAIEKSLEIHPEDRYQSVDEFRLALIGASGSSQRRANSAALTVPPPPPEVIEAIARGQAPQPKLISEPVIEMSGEAKGRKRRRLVDRVRIWTYVIGAGVLAGIVLFIFLLYQIPQNNFGIGTSAPQVTSTELVAVAPPDTEEAPVEPTPTEEQVVEEATETVFQATETAAEFIPSGATGGGGGLLAYASDRTGFPQIWTMTVEGTQQTQLTSLEGGACQPEWSPDGTQIAFISPCEEERLLYLDSNIYIMNVNGSDLRQLPTRIGSFDPAWSPTNEYMLYTVGFDSNRSQIFRLNLQDNTTENLTNNEKLNMHPVWSPDGRRIIFVSAINGGLRLFVIPNVPGSDPVIFSRSGDNENTFPTWAPIDGVQVIFNQQPAGGGLPYLVRLPLEMLGVSVADYREVILPRDSVVPERGPDYSVDGQWIAFESWPDGENHDIFITLINGTQQARLTTDPAFDFDPAWQP
ncbi:MAG: hypothetical protein DWQ07_22230 [Chloroflexi bacterium]|nr:MAG: hypothetical protein DWQ07_22230 [Chloroflexota bacterium]MBL1196326.1 hypothetical protein [Chloroflexota bacterium]NOH13621.1 serine/threonine-protein kinase [Chloroflexota bacterium]